MDSVLFDPARHEQRCTDPWCADTAASVIATIGEWTRSSFDQTTWWPTHPLDVDDTREAAPEASLYLGGAGVVWCLYELERAGLLSPGLDFRDALPAMERYNRTVLGGETWRRLLGAGWQTRSWLLGDAGILFARWIIDRDPTTLDALAQVCASNTDDPSRELMWGAAGTTLPAVALHTATGDPRWAALYAAGVDALENSLLPLGSAGSHVWQQTLYGRNRRYLGAVHGFAGNVFAMAEGRHLLSLSRWQSLLGKIVRTVHLTARSDSHGVNWPAAVDSEGRQPLLLQHCHGAAGMITSLAGLDPSMDELLCRAGELVWHAGPLKKGAGLCHGTTGNGYAFLRLFEVSGDELWLERARAFAMHAIRQSEAHAATFKQHRYSLWTGDLGVACYLRDCIDGMFRFPTLRL